MKASTRSAVSSRMERPRICEAGKSGSPSATIPKYLALTPWRAHQTEIARLRCSSIDMSVGVSRVAMKANIIRKYERVTIRFDSG